MLDIIVTGAGIAGLSTALSLRRAGHRVTIYERSSLSPAHEVGAAINVPPNASRFLLPCWGLDPQAHRFVKATRAEFMDAATLAKGQSVDHAKNVERFGAELWLAHRVDLHQALRTLAEQEEGEGTPVVIHTNSFVVSYVSHIPIPPPIIPPDDHNSYVTW